MKPEILQARQSLLDEIHASNDAKVMRSTASSCRRLPSLPLASEHALNPVPSANRPDADTITTSRRFKCVPQILGSSSIHIFRLLFLPLSITFRRIHERNSFDLGAICLFCFEFCCLIDFLIPLVT